MKNFYSCLDTGFIKYVPQPLQHLAISDKAGKLGGKVVFYTAEDFETLESQGVIKAKVQEKSEKFDGIIFFTLKQFFYGGKLNFKFLKFILDSGYEVHFARENISISNIEALYRAFPILYAAQYVSERDDPRDFWKPVWNWLDRKHE